jgi:hypothetical protein
VLIEKERNAPLSMMQAMLALIELAAKGALKDPRWVKAA